MFEVFAEWFGQGFRFPVIAVDVLFFLAGAWAVLIHWSSAKKIIAVPASLLVLSMILQFVPNFLVEILAVLLCGFGSMMLAGAVIAWGVCWLIVRYRKRKEENS